MILIKANVTAADAAEVREAGATELLAKPFSVQALRDRLAAVFQKPRPFVVAQAFKGPDRRRRDNDGGAHRRQTDRN